MQFRRLGFVLTRSVAAALLGDDLLDPLGKEGVAIRNELPTCLPDLQMGVRGGPEGFPLGLVAVANLQHKQHIHFINEITRRLKKGPINHTQRRRIARV